MRLAARQRGAFTLTQADELGWRARAVHRRVARGELRAPQPGVFAFAASPATWEQRLLVATLATGPGTGISHESSAILYRCEDWIDGFARPIHLSLPGGRHPRLRRLDLHRVQLPSEDLTTVDGIPCTTFARTVMDLSGRASLGQVARAIDHGLVGNLVTMRELWRCCLRLGPAPGRRPKRVALLLSERTNENENADSRPEIRLYNTIVGGGLPAPVTQHWVTVAGERFRFDVAYPDLRLGVEYFGFDPHRARTAFDRDFRRDRRLTNAGWTVLYFTRACTDADIVTDVRAALDRLTR